jgi:hypothetical protein
MRSFLETLLVGGILVGRLGAVSVSENYTICNWARLRAGVVRDALYLDGGELWWQTAFVDGTTPVVSSDGNVAGDMFRLNFSQPYNTATTNLSALFERMPKAGGAGNNIAPNYIDGTMFTNDGELYLYGCVDTFAIVYSADNVQRSSSSDRCLLASKFIFRPGLRSLPIWSISLQLDAWLLRRNPLRWSHQVYHERRRGVGPE